MSPSPAPASLHRSPPQLQQTQASTNVQTQQQQSSSPTAATSSPTLQSPPNSGSSSSAQLATLLTNALREAEGLRKDLATATRRLSKAERLLSTFQSASGQTGSPNGTSSAQPQTNGTPQLPESAVKAILESNERAERAERAREDAELRCRPSFRNGPN